MTNRVLELDTYPFSSKDELFFDANIWLFLHGPSPVADRKKMAAYSAAFKKILAAGCRIFIDAVIVSEFINTCARYQWRANHHTSGNFKQFRKTGAFQSIAVSIAADVRLILKHCQRVESDFSNLNMDTVLKEYAAGNIDFNDQIIAGLCQSKGFKLVTDDRDFAGQGFPVLTANRRMLKETPSSIA